MPIGDPTDSQVAYNAQLAAAKASNDYFANTIAPQQANLSISAANGSFVASLQQTLVGVAAAVLGAVTSTQGRLNQNETKGFFGGG